MHLAPGLNGSVVFNVSLGGTQSDIGTPAITILRNGIVTTVPVTIDNSVVGRYVGNFTVPSNWVEYDEVHALFTLSYMLGTMAQGLECSKPVGVVTIAPQSTEFIADLLVADQIRTRNGDGTYTIRYFQEGSNQTVLLHEQIQTGDPCDDPQVSLIAT